jgi:hypothetical protein
MVPLALSDYAFDRLPLLPPQGRTDEGRSGENSTCASDSFLLSFGLIAFSSAALKGRENKAKSNEKGQQMNYLLPQPS